MKFFGYFKSLAGSGTGNSAKSFALLMSTLMGCIMSLTVCFVLVWDVVHNGSVMTDLEKLGLFLLCIGAYITGSGIPKIFGEKYANVLKKDDSLSLKEEEEN